MFRKIVSSKEIDRFYLKKNIFKFFFCVVFPKDIKSFWSFLFCYWTKQKSCGGFWSVFVDLEYLLVAFVFWDGTNIRGGAVKDREGVAGRGGSCRVLAQTRWRRLVAGQLGDIPLSFSLTLKFSSQPERGRKEKKSPLQVHSLL